MTRPSSSPSTSMSALQLSEVAELDDHRVGRWLQKHRRLVLVTLILLTTIIRVVYFQQANSSPLPLLDRWQVSDMHFFRVWAHSLANEDWWQAKPLYPQPQWMTDRAISFLNNHPEQRKRLRETARKNGQTTPLDDKALATLLWQKWFGGTRYYQEPLYPYLLAMTFRLLGENVRWIFVLQMLVGILTVLMIHEITRRYFGHTAAILAGCFAALYAPQLFYEAVLLRVTLVTGAGFLLVYLCPPSQAEITWRRAFGSGFLVGLTLLLKTTFFILSIALLAGWLLQGRGRRRTLLPKILAAILGVMIAIAPVVIRNAKVGAPLLSWSSVSSLAFISGNTADATVGLGNMFSKKYTAQILNDTHGKFFATIEATLATHPDVGSVLDMYGRKFASLLQWQEVPNNTNFYFWRKYIPLLRLPITFYWLAPMGLVGIFIALRFWRKAWPLYLLVLTSFAPLLLVTNLGRYRLPLAMAVLPFAAFFSVQLFVWLKQGAHLPLLLSVLTAALLFWYVGQAPGYVPVRMADYGAAYKFGWQANVETALREKKYAQAAAVYEDFLRGEPAHERDIRLATKRWRSVPYLVAKYFINFHYNLAILYKKLGQSKRSALHFSRAAELKKLAALLPTLKSGLRQQTAKNTSNKQ